MKYQIIGKNVSITDGISSAVQKKLAKIEKHLTVNDDIECRVVVSAHKDSQKIEITIFLPQVTLRAEVSDRDLYCAIDTAVEKLEGQIRKLKTRMDRSNGKISIGRALDLETIEEEPIPEKDVIVRAKSYYLKEMTIDEAIARMEALGHDFFLYLDKEDDRVSVVYVRRDGGYGVIQAENPIK